MGSRPWDAPLPADYEEFIQVLPSVSEHGMQSQVSSLRNSATPEKEFLPLWRN